MVAYSWIPLGYMYSTSPGEQSPPVTQSVFPCPEQKKNRKIHFNEEATTPHTARLISSIQLTLVIVITRSLGPVKVSLYY